MADASGSLDGGELDRTLDNSESLDEATVVGTDDPQSLYPLDSPLEDPQVMQELNERSDELGELQMADDATSTIDGGLLVGAEDGSDSPEEAAMHVEGGPAISERDLPPLDQLPPQ